MAGKTMRAVIFKDDYKVAVEDVPVPTIKAPTDAILRVSSTALCGSDLHYYRGHAGAKPGFICGHEFVGEIVEKGDAVSKFKIGDKVVVPFYTACGDCYYCVRGQASRCAKGELFGNSTPANTIDGGQAEFVRVPLADSTFVLTPKNIPEEMLVLMADIFPTGYFAASRFLKNLPERDRREFTAVVVGCGPVGLCAIACALTMVDTVYAIDSVPDRLKEAERLGAKTIPLKDPENPDNEKYNPADLVKAATGGRGADVALEVVGHSSAFHLCFDMIRPFGSISSIGVYTQKFEVNGTMLYGKNVTMAFGRCPVRSIFEESLEMLVKLQDKLGFLCDKTMSLEDAPQAFVDFEQRKFHKIIFKIGAPGEAKA